MKNVIRQLFIDHPDSLHEVSVSAHRAETLISTLSPTIESLTSLICPECRNVCCINRHSRFDRSDVIFMSALNKEIPEDSPGLDDKDPCRFLGRFGCRLMRPDRPYRCTWFFCDQLLEQMMQKTPAKEQRRFLQLLAGISEIRTKMINDFETIAAGLPLLYGDIQPAKNK